MVRARRGFTLIEVLGAVVLLGLVVTYVSRAAIQSLGFAGDAQRRLSASLLADRIVTEIEEASAAGTAPELGEKQLQEPDDPDFQASVKVAPLDPAAFGIAKLLEPQDPRSGSAPVTDLFEPERGAQPAVFSVEVHVRWADGMYKREVVRTTVLLTPAAVPELAALAATTGPGAAGAPGSTGSPGASGSPAGAAPGTGTGSPAGAGTVRSFRSPLPQGVPQ